MVNKSVKIVCGRYTKNEKLFIIMIRFISV